MTATNTRVSVRSNVGTLTLYVTTCATCGVIFALEDTYDECRRKDGRGFYCPNGHSLSYKTTETDRLRKELDNTKRRLESAQREANWQGQRALENARSAAAYKGHLTRIRRRIAAGVCPCCRRTFSNVERHIQGQHPEFVAKATEAMQGAAS
jgi:hypothetical protein